MTALEQIYIKAGAPVGNNNAAGRHSSRHATFEDEKKEMESDSTKGVGRNGATFITKQTKGWVGVIETPTHYIDEHLQTGARREVEKSSTRATDHSATATELAASLETIYAKAQRQTA